MSKSLLNNFNPGPAVLPPQVIEATQKALVSVEGGPGILELSHRGKAFDQLIHTARERIIQLYQIPQTHEVLFLQGGASLQFAMVPMNLGAYSGHINTGEWSSRALAEARLVKREEEQAPLELWSSSSSRFNMVPQDPIMLPTHETALPYIHLTSNNTIYGTQYRTLPTFVDAMHQPLSVHQTPSLVIDASSDIFSQEIDWSRVGLLYAGAQKNAGAAGVTLVIGRRDWLYGDPVLPWCPKIMRYRTHAEKDSLYHTPNTLGIFVVGEVARWVLEQGGIETMKTQASRRAQAVYEVIDAYPQTFMGHADARSRSYMNITFRGITEEIEQTLLAQATQERMIGLKGHRSVGGLRASLYNAISDESVTKLVHLLDQIGQKTSC